MMKLLKKNLSSLISHLSSRRGFTLIELLIVIAILGILAAGVLVAVDPVDKINAANDSKVQNDVSGAGRASEAYAIVHSGFYPSTLNDLVNSGELKRAPVAPDGYNVYLVTGSPPGCQGGGSVLLCTSVVITGQLKSKKFTGSGTPVWRYESTSGKSCAVATAGTVCP